MLGGVVVDVCSVCMRARAYLNRHDTFCKWYHTMAGFEPADERELAAVANAVEKQEQNALQFTPTDELQLNNVGEAMESFVTCVRYCACSERWVDVVFGV